jgi:hypothetical protein
MKQSLKQTQMKLLDSQNYLEKRVEERTEELQQKIDELKNYKRLTVNRELKMVELKKEINRLHENLRYNAAEESKKQEKI